MAVSSYTLAIPLLAAVVSANIPTQQPTSCAAVFCGQGTVCREETYNCVKAPCPGRVARCVPITTEKPGSCPVQDLGHIGICLARCSTDADCNGHLKCCGNCPRECTPPAPPIVKPDICPKSPTPYWYQRGNCPLSHKCRNDSDCGRNSKCCGTCPRICVNLTRG
ncbi:perlwapin-like [Haliotis cracherodii]|uniref:perlwapin-like n=1 Tax=Haliotis cracherodii TaxID=6455 RepID=UPI0039E78E87